MLAIYKKELRSYFHSMIGYVFIAFFLAIVGIYFYAYNMVYGLANFEYVLNTINFLYIILVPILTMKLMAEEKRQKTDQLLFTSPVSIYKIILGKYLAVITLFLVCIMVTCTYPLILSLYGTVSFGTAYASILGFTLMGAAYIAIGLFISILTESQVIAAVVTFLVMLLTYLMTGIASMLPSDKLSCLIMISILAVLFCYIIYLTMRKIKISIGLFVGIEAVLVIVYRIKPELFDNLLVKVLSWFSVMDRYENFSLGIFDMTAIVYYISVAVLFVVLAVLFTKQSLCDKRNIAGLYRTGVMVFVTVTAILINMAFSVLDLTFDLSKNGLYSISDATIDLVKGLEDDITIYYVVQDGSEDSLIEKIVSKYEKTGEKINVVKKDPVLYPAFCAQYTSEDVSNNSLIVVNNTTGVSRYLPSEELYITDIDYSSYQSYHSGIDVEGQLTSAISYVTSNELPKIYTVTGHGETALNEMVIKSIEKQNVTTEELSTLTAESIPDDCSLLLINGPVYDFQESEISIIKDYMENGGKAIIFTSYTTEKMDVFYEFLGNYGVETVEGIVVEGAGYYMNNMPTYLVPDYVSHEVTATAEAEGKYAVIPYAQGLTIQSELRDTLSVVSFLDTSPDSFSKVDVNSNTIEMEDGDIKGPFSLGVAVTETLDAEEGEEAKEAKLIIMSTPYVIDSNIVATNQFGNLNILNDSISWMTEVKAGISIPSKSFDENYITIAGNMANLWGAVLVFIIPGAILIVGVVVWVKRRKC
ncbi:Gldg family protein [Anaeromicropila populeti]|uniref:ABC-2 type transport system permease protein n=1 Tax=Anaeromicropila populeti TaxID=37658 RepID=A0A1I6HRV8_9FIRM|nr:Gldg family protein [Anaeromicropila populeti]SFR57098.1 ABC-2 type transport system permease protein [Anaeromicropila populeti]